MPRRMGDSSAAGVDAVPEQPLAVVEVVDGPEALGAREQAVDHDAEEVGGDQLHQLVAAPRRGLSAQPVAETAPERLDEGGQRHAQVRVAGPRRGLSQDPLRPVEREDQAEQAGALHGRGHRRQPASAARAGGGVGEVLNPMEPPSRAMRLTGAT